MEADNISRFLTSMPTENAKEGLVALFLFAHQDDECGVFYSIEEELKKKRKVVCVYLTDGGYSGVSPKIRNRESTAVLTKLGVKTNNIWFVGEEVGIYDMHMHEYLNLGYSYLAQRVDRENLIIESVYSPAWEGGHPDHDAVNLIAQKLVFYKWKEIETWQFPLYNSFGCPFTFFKVMSPLYNNGPIMARYIPWPRRLYYVTLCLFYKSQWKTWIGLFPFVCCHYLIKGRQYLQCLTNKYTPPHNGPLYYERRKFAKYEDIKKYAIKFFT